MKITKAKLKQIIKEALEDEEIEKIKKLMFSGDPNAMQYAAEMLDLLAPDRTSNIFVYLVCSYGIDGDQPRVHGAYSTVQKAKAAMAGISLIQSQNLETALHIEPIPIDDPLKSRMPGGSYDYLVGYGEGWD